MNATEIKPRIRKAELFFSIDSGLLNRRLGIATLPPPIHSLYHNNLQSGSDFATKRSNDQMLVHMLTDVCWTAEVPTLLEALTLDCNKPRLFMSVERLAAGDGVYDENVATNRVELPVGADLPIDVVYHTEHFVSSTGRESLARGAREAVIGVLHREPERYRIQPIVIGTPLFKSSWNPPDENQDHLMWSGTVMAYGELFPEDIDQFSGMLEVNCPDRDVWTDTMRCLPEREIKSMLGDILGDTTKNDWGGEASDHFTASLSVEGRRSTAAFLLKGPGNGFREMTLDMCGARANQILRLSKEPADIFVVQHCHDISPDVREVLHALTIRPGGSPSRRARKYCLIDGKSTYRILKAHDLL